MQLQSTDFELFALPVRYAQDPAAIDARWKALQREAHPDRFAAQGVVAQRVAMQWSVRINEAYRRLKDPLQRARYWCELHGAPADAERNTAMPAEFLTQQMVWREALDDASSAAAVDALAAEVAAVEADLFADCARAIDTEKNPARAVEMVRALMFSTRFRADVAARRDALEAAT